MDLAPNAWQGEVDAYIVIDTGNPAVGERAIPNEVDIATDMRWESCGCRLRARSRLHFCRHQSLQQ